MSKDSFYFSHDYNARSDPRLQRLSMKLGMEGIGIYWCIIEMLYEQAGYIPLVDIESIAFALHTECERIKSVLQNFDLFKFEDESFFSESVLRRLDVRFSKSNNAKKAALKRWDTKRKSKRNANAMQTHSEGNANKEKESKVNNKEIYNTFYDTEIEKSNSDENYLRIVKILFGENNLAIPLKSVLKMEEQLSYEQAKRLIYLKAQYKFSISDVLEEMENWKDLKNRKTVYKTFLTFVKNKVPNLVLK